MDAAGGDYEFTPFDQLHTATSSESYRRAIRASSPDLPEWLLPASVLNIGDLRMIAAGVNVGAGQTIVDLGCGGGGPGLWVAEQTGASLIGVDASRRAITIAAALAEIRGMTDRARFDVRDLSATALADECADGIMSLDALMFVEPFTPTLVRDYRPIFEEAGFTILRHEEVEDYRVRSLAYFQAIENQANAMFAEIGSGANVLIDEARESLEKAKQPPRVQTVCFMAQR